MLAGLAGCSGRPAAPARPDAAPRVRADAAPVLIRVREGAGLLFSFFDERAELRTVERLDQVSPSARGEVMVTDPRRPLPGDTVLLADLRKAGPGGDYRAWVDRRGAWLDRVMPKLSQLRGPLLAAAGTPGKAAPPKLLKKKKRARRRHRPAVAAAPGEAPQPRVLLFSTSGCPHCRAAHAYLSGRGIRFAELDVERDPQAAELYQKIATSHGLKPGGVPMIVVDGRPMMGFSKPQLEAVLAASGLAASH